MFFNTKRFLYLAAFLSIFFSGKAQAQNALNFDGTDDYVQTSFDGILGSANRTFEAWVNLSSSASGTNAIIDYGLNASGSRNTFSVSSSNQLTFVSGGTNANISSTSNVVTAGQWTHVAFVLDSGTGYLYVNGVQVGTGSLTSVNTPTTGGDLRIGQRVSGGSIPFMGSIDEVRIWNYARTATEIANNMTSEYCSVPTGLVAYYKLNEGIAGGTNSGVTSTYDASGNGNNGTLNTFALTGSTSNWVTGYPLTVPSLTGSESVTSCGASYTSPSGNYTWTQAGVYQDTIQTVAGCDSVLTITLDFNTSSSASIIENACYSYTSPSGAFTWSSSGTYQDTLVNAAGCDSIITIDLSINNTYDTIDVIGCGTYTSPSGNYTWTNTGTYFDTITNSFGCDSLLFIHVQIEQDVTVTIDEDACVSYTSPSGLFTWTSSGTYQDFLVASTGCDSIININLTVTEVDTAVSQSGQVLTASAIGAGVTYQWINCANGNPVNGATLKIFEPANTGNYAVVVTNDGCSDTSACTNVIVVGISVLEQNDLKVYPNPTTGQITISMESVNVSSTLRLYDLRGQLVQQKVLSKTQTEWTMPDAAGVYLLEISSGGEVWRKQVIKR